MTRTIGDMLADVVLQAKTPDERRQIAVAAAAYGLGVIAAMDGDKAGAETGYRLADALAARSAEQ